MLVTMSGSHIIHLEVGGWGVRVLKLGVGHGILSKREKVINQGAGESICLINRIQIQI
jgi:hypothetical protein